MKAAMRVHIGCVAEECMGLRCLQGRDCLAELRHLEVKPTFWPSWMSGHSHPLVFNAPAMVTNVDARGGGSSVQCAMMDADHKQKKRSRRRRLRRPLHHRGAAQPGGAMFGGARAV